MEDDDDDDSDIDSCLDDDDDYDSVLDDDDDDDDDAPSDSYREKTAPMLTEIAQKLGVREVIMTREDVQPAGKSENGLFVIKDDRYRDIAEFTLVPFPGCCGMVILTGVLVMESYEGLGIGTIINKISQVISLNWGYTVMMCTDVENNIPQQKIMNRTGWTKLQTFNNSRTYNDVCIHSINLRAT
jgi:hypothetical protein